MKRLALTISALLLSVTVLSFTACSSGDGGSPAAPVESSTTESTTESDASAGGSDAKTEAPAGGSGTTEPAAGSDSK